ncbi:MAG: hypothetical protein ACD_15C00151G0006 [uncultured bacterium]|nr:MAG: hypothetical protein ACD_15C00151G0006 [uncultured bacterium]
MRYLGKESLKGKLALALYALILAVGVSFIISPTALANGDDRYVMIGNNKYDVDHDGEGPHIIVNGVKHYLDAKSDNDMVVVAGKQYDVRGDKDDDNDDDDDDDDDDD